MTHAAVPLKQAPLQRGAQQTLFLALATFLVPPARAIHSGFRMPTQPMARETAPASAPLSTNPPPPGAVDMEPKVSSSHNVVGHFSSARRVSVLPAVLDTSAT